MNLCLVVPHYNHEQAFADFLPTLQTLSLPCIVVDDGSSTQSLELVQQLVADYDNIHLFEHGYNRGKGAAVITAFYHARTMGYTHVIQIDADGQHDIKDVQRFIDYGTLHPNTIVSGKPTFDDSAPKARLYGRRVTDFWVALETLSLQIKDSLCGFRLFPLQEMEHLLDNYHIGPRMDFDTDILVKAVWEDIPLHFIPTRVIYPDNSVSHFHYLRDNCLLIRLHSRLLLGMVWRAPKLLYRRLRSWLSKSKI
ncbi:MAG: glycosyltransferase family 2 protein [Arenicella sp.]